MAQVEVDENGIIAQMQRVIDAQKVFEDELSELRRVLWKGKLKEKGSSEEPPKTYHQ